MSSAWRVLAAASIVTLSLSARVPRTPTATLGGTPTYKYLMTFLACDTGTYTDCDHPTHHLTYLAESTDGSTWRIVPGWVPFSGSTPSPVRRGDKLYIFYALSSAGPTGHAVVRYDFSTRTWEGPYDVILSGDPRSNNGMLDPTPILDDQQRIVLVYKSATASDIGTCNPGQTCTRYFHSATETSGTDGVSFDSDSQPRVAWTQTPTNSDGAELAADVYVYAAPSQYIIYISGPYTSSITFWTSSTLRGSYAIGTTIANGLLSNGTGGVPAGYYDSSTSRYWSFSHTSQNGVSVIRRAVHANFSTQLSESSWTTIASASSLGLGARVSVESVGFAVNFPVISGVSPSSTGSGGGTTVTITGTNFVSGGTTVSIGGTAATGVSVSSTTSLTAVVPAHAAGAVSVSATTTDGTGSLASAFTYYASLFTDDPLQAAITAVKAVHVTECRSYIDTLRARYGLTAVSWTNATLTAGTTTVRAAHIAELRSALNGVYAAAGRAAPGYTDSVLSPSVTIKAVHITEIRAAITAVY